MGMEMKLQFKLSQQLVMTPQLVRSDPAAPALPARVGRRGPQRCDGEKRPVLADDSTDPKAREAGREARPSLKDAASNEERLDSMERSDRDTTDLSVRENEKRAKEVDWEQFLENRQLQRSLPSHRGGFEEMPPIVRTSPSPRTCTTTCVWQLQMSDFVENERAFAELILGNLDEKGYLDLKGGEGPANEKLPDVTLADLAPRDRPRPGGRRRGAQHHPALRPDRRRRARPRGVSARAGRDARLRQDGARDHQGSPPQRRAQEPRRDRKGPQDRARRGLRGRPGDPKARERPRPQLRRDRREDDRHHARRLRDQGRRRLRRLRQRQGPPAPLHQREPRPEDAEGPQGQGVHQREAAQRAVADPCHRATAADHHQGHRVHR